ncbi:MAG: aminotransferase class IV, partial [Deltaproteobacteria bacterium]|nr:aminotransferase class IV [Deltaproteobacteria bacterium]
IERTCQRFFGGGPEFKLEEVLPRHLPKVGLFKVRLIYGPKVDLIEAAPYEVKKIKTLEVVWAKPFDYGHKYLDRGQINRLKANSQADDIIIVMDGLVTDSSIANLVFKNEKGLFTPEKCLLPGIKREFLLKKGLIKSKNIKVEDLSQYSGLSLINAMIDLEDQVGLPVQNIIQGAF